jgi:signal transduction histidine kinase
MFLTTLTAAIISISAFSYAAVIFFRKKDDILARYLGYSIIAAAFCIAVNGLADLAKTPNILIFLSGVGIISAGFFISFFLCFIELFVQKKLSRKKFLIFIIPTLINSLFAFSRYNIKEVLFPPNHPAEIVPGLLYGFLPFFALAGIIYCGIIIKKRSGEFTVWQRAQIKYLFLGFIITLAGASIFSIILPFYGELGYFSVGPQFLIFLLGFTAYAILKHGLLDTRIVIQKSIWYALAFGLFFVFYLGIFFMLDKLFRLIMLRNEVSTLILAALIIAIYPGLKNIFLKKTDRLFYRFPYDSREVLSLINRNCHLVVEYQEYFACLSEIFEKKLKINKFLLVTLRKNQIHQIYNHNFSRRLIKLLKNLKAVPFDLMNYFSQFRKKELIFFKNPELDKILATQDFYMETIAKLSNFDVNLFLPIYNKNVLVGFIFLGPKMSGESYYPQDLQLFDELMERFSLAFENIELYQEIKKYNLLLESKVQKRTEELKLQHESQIRFTADISHELQTPLAILKGNLSLINQKIISQEEMVRGFARMERSVDRLSNIIKDLIFLTKADAGKIQVDKRDFNLSQAVRAVYDDSYILAEDKKVEFQLEILSEIKIIADEEKIKSLLFNLISNALKFTPAGSKIRITLSEYFDNAYILVEDEGIGIAAKDQPNIFSRFYRIDNPDNQKGSGLGLAICKWIVNSHGGEITVKSEIGQGTIFKVILPLRLKV